MTLMDLFREDEIYRARVLKYSTNDCIAAYDPEDYFNNIVADIYGNGYKIRAIEQGNHTVIFYVEDIK
jgi:hypothetical protein